jgi:hypothetical protein
MLGVIDNFQGLGSLSYLVHIVVQSFGFCTQIVQMQKNGIKRECFSAFRVEL